MSRTSKSPLAVARAAYEAGQAALPRYAHKFSRRDFTCPQLFAILVIRKFFKTDYRGVIAILAEFQELRDVLDLHDKLPHFTTPQKASAKLLDDPLIRKILTQTIEIFFRLKRDRAISDDDVAWVLRLDRVAGDSTGLESGHCSRYFTNRRKHSKNKGDPHSDDSGEPVSYRRYPKLSVLIDTATHFILSTHRGIGPRPDVDELAPLLDDLPEFIQPRHGLFDAGYDSEANHQRLAERHIFGLIPPTVGRPSNKPAASPIRRAMQHLFEHPEVFDFGQRWQVESVMHMIKRRQGTATTARRDHTRHHELGLIALTHNLLILAITELFYRALPTPFLLPRVGRLRPTLAGRDRHEPAQTQPRPRHYLTPVPPKPRPAPALPHPQRHDPMQP